MNMLNDSPEIALPHRSFQAMRDGDFAILEEGATNCPGARHDHRCDEP